MNKMRAGTLTPALQVALFERSHDRNFIIQLENSMISFIASPATSFQLDPMNSYYRLLAHQAAEYHGLGHTLSKMNDTCVVLFKGDMFERILDLTLLQNLDPPSQLGNKELGQSCQSEQTLQSNVIENSRQDKVNDGAGSTLEDNQKPSGALETPKKPLPVDDDSPQPHQFETSRYRFRRQAEKPRRKKVYRNHTDYIAPPVFFAPPPALHTPYMVYNPYPMLPVPPEHHFSQFPPPAHPGQFENPFMYGWGMARMSPYKSGSSNSSYSKRSDVPSKARSTDSLGGSSCGTQGSSESQMGSSAELKNVSDKMVK